MKAFLLHPDRDFDWTREDPPGTAALVQDLEVDTVVAAMARDDERIRASARAVLLAGTVDLATLRHRQAVVRDCVAHPDVVRELYALTLEAIEAERKRGTSVMFSSPSMLLHRGVEVMEMLVVHLDRLATVARDRGPASGSEAFRTLFSTLRRELRPDYLADVSSSLRRLKLRGGVLMSARLGAGNRSRDYALRRADGRRHGWLARLLRRRAEGYTFTLAPRDDAGARALSELQDRGVEVASDALRASVDHVVNFFKMLRAELAFYVGALNLHEAFAERDVPVCYPEMASPGRRDLSARALRDPCLALALGRGAVGNDLAADGKDVLLVTGANRGGKSTFLRSLGLAAVMMRSGMFVVAERFSAELPERIFTHYRRQEDAAMESGKFDEELARMSSVVDGLVPNSLVLFNESFASTNEREGSEVARQIVTALREHGMRVAFVTHQHAFARGFLDRHAPACLFLRAEREDDGRRSFVVGEGPPLPTSFGRDLYARIFGVGAEPTDFGQHWTRGDGVPPSTARSG